MWDYLGPCDWDKNFIKKVKRFLLCNKINFLGGENEEFIF